MELAQAMAEIPRAVTAFVHAVTQIAIWVIQHAAAVSPRETAVAGRLWTGGAFLSPETGGSVRALKVAARTIAQEALPFERMSGRRA